MRQWDLDLVVGFAADETMVVAQFVFGGILDRHPQFHLHIPHAGGNAPWLKGRFEMALRKRPWAKGLLTRSLDDVWRQMSFDCLIKPGPNMEMLVKAEGADRILLGTNFAGWDQDDTIVASVESLPFPAATATLILAGNARRLFGVRHVGSRSERSAHGVEALQIRNLTFARVSDRQRRAPVEHIEAAAAGGFDAAGLRIVAPSHLPMATA